MIVYWTETAIKHLTAIYHHIAQDSPFYAQRVADKIIRRSEQIAIFPQSGRRVPEYDDPNIREIIEPPYHLIYRIKIDQIDILAVIHGARRFPEKP
jgi:plasmid stabilization system protein ParE